MNIEDRLREALRREPAPADFKRKLLARLPDRRIVTAPFWRRPAALAVAAALCLGILIPEAATEYRHRQRERGIEAERQLVTALAVTNTKLRETKRMIRRITRHSS